MHAEESRRASQAIAQVAVLRYVAIICGGRYDIPLAGLSHRFVTDSRLRGVHWIGEYFKRMIA